MAVINRENEIELDECGVETQDSWAKRQVAEKQLTKVELFLLKEALSDAREFVYRHTEDWYKPGKELLYKIDFALGFIKNE